jgi:hypothetical protein
MKCPNCPSSTLVITERRGVEIDYCPHCRGVWLDRGELDKLIERSLREPPPPHGSLGYERTATRRPRKSSWLSDIFD